MTLPSLQLSEPLVTAMVGLLSSNLNAEIDLLNATVTDGFTIDHAAQVLPYVPVPSTLMGGTPAIGVQDMPATFEDDLQYNTDALHEYAIVAVIQNADQQALAWQLRRTVQAIANTISQDRLLGQSSVMLTQGGAWSVNFLRTEPGPLLGDLDPTNPEAPPRSYLSWAALVCSSKRREI